MLCCGALFCFTLFCLNHASLISLLFTGHKLALTLQSTNVHNQENEENNFALFPVPGTSLEPEIRGWTTCLLPFHLQMLTK